MATDLENFPTSESAKKMLSYVSDGFYDNSYVGKWIYQVMGHEYDTAYEMVESLPDQLFPETATWGLMFHEMKWGLPVKNDVSAEERRKLIYRKRDEKRSITPYQMERLLSSIIDCTVHIYDIHDTDNGNYVPGHPNEFIISIETEELNIDTEYIKQTVKNLKQTHTTYSIRENFKRKLWSDKNYAGVVIKHITRRCL